MKGYKSQNLAGSIDHTDQGEPCRNEGKLRINPKHSPLPSCLDDHLHYINFSSLNTKKHHIGIGHGTIPFWPLTVLQQTISWEQCCFQMVIKIILQSIHPRRTGKDTRRQQNVYVPKYTSHKKSTTEA